MSLKNQVLLVAMVLVLTVSQDNIFCSQFNSDGVCLQCYLGFFLNPSKICTFGNPNCKTFANDGTGNCAICWDVTRDIPTCSAQTVKICATYEEGGNCLTCPSGYVLSAGSCFYPIIFCSTYASDGSCTACAEGYILNTGACVNPCSAGYILSNGVCTLPSAPLDPHCSQFASNNVCTSCKKGFYFNSAHVCTLGDPNCDIFTTDGTGSCATCYFGHVLVGGVCQKDPFCLTYKINGCAFCFNGYFVGSLGTCVLLP